MRNILPVLLAGVMPFAAGAQVVADRDSSVTVYNSNLGLVRKTIDLDLVKGIQTVSFGGVAGRIDATSVRLDDPRGGVRIVEQNFRFDTAGTAQMLEAYLDREITLYLDGGAVIRGTLLSAGGDLMLRDSGGKVVIVRLDAVERYEFPELPAGLVNRPTLFWTVESDRAGRIPLQLSYLAEGLSWQAEYTAVVNENQTRLGISALASIQNQSGGGFEEVRLKLVAGEINRVSPPAPTALFKGRMMAAEALSDQGGGFEEQGVFEYHVYDLRGRTTLDQAAVKQVAIFSPVSVDIQREYVFNANRYREDVMTVLKFTNAEKTGPGLPLPAGRVRVYQDDRGANLLIGEDSIDHTPVGGDVRLSVGKAFELSGERRVMETRTVSSRVNEQQIAVVLRNRKAGLVTIAVLENLPGNGEITAKSHDFVRKDARTAEFTVPVPAKGETTLHYTVRYTY